MSLYPPLGRFWSAIIVQQQGSVSISAGSTVYVDVQPPSGETWLVTFALSARTHNVSGHEAQVAYNDFDGTSARMHAENYVSAPTNDYQARALTVERVLTNSLYARLGFYSTYASTGYYGYSGFKLSKPLWNPIRLNGDLRPWKLPPSSELPPKIGMLKGYAYDVLGADPSKPNEYSLAIVLEEDTPIAVNEKGDVVEKFTAIVSAEALNSMFDNILADTKDTLGYAKYLNKWRREGLI